MRPWPERRMEQLVGTILRTGVLLATALVLAGAVLALAHHGAERVDYRRFHPEPWALAGLSDVLRHPLDPTGRVLVRLGLLALIATPIARVIFCAFAFLAQRDRTYAAIAVAVLAVLAISLFGAVP